MLKNFTIVCAENFKELLPSVMFFGVKHVISKNTGNVYRISRYNIRLIDGESNDEEKLELETIFNEYSMSWSTGDVQSGEDEAYDILYNGEVTNFRSNSQKYWFSDDDSWYSTTQLAKKVKVSPELLVLIFNYVFGD